MRARDLEKHPRGWVAERFKAPVLKTGDVQASVGSNPTPSASRPSFILHSRYNCSTVPNCGACLAAQKGTRMLSKLPPRERQIVDILYQRGALAVADICDALPVQLSGSAVRAMLSRLEKKGFVRRSESDRGFLYSPVVSDTVAKKSALSEIVRVFFNGSPASAASALLGMSDKLKEDELDKLEEMIARARKAKGGQ